MMLEIEIQSLIISHLPYYVFCILGISWLISWHKELKKINKNLKGG